MNLYEISYCNQAGTPSIVHVNAESSEQARAWFETCECNDGETICSIREGASSSRPGVPVLTVPANWQAAEGGKKAAHVADTAKKFLCVSSMAEAWQAANDLFPTDYMLDSERSARAGYPVYHSTAEGVNAYICDLGDRLELNFSDGSSFNVWVEDEKPSTADPEPVKASAPASAPVRLADLIPLRCKVTIYVPSTVNVNQAADNTAQVERVARFMSDAFGGATASPVSGYWVAADSSLVAERTTMVFSYCTSEQAERYIDDIVRLCVAIRDEMGQEAVALEYNGSMYFI